MAANRLSDSRRQAFLRRHLFPARRRHGPPRLSPHPPRRSRSLPHPPRRSRQNRQSHRRRRFPSRSLQRRPRRFRSQRRRRNGRRNSTHVRSAQRRLRPIPKISPRGRDRSASRALSIHQRTRVTNGSRKNAREDGPRRRLRSISRRLPSLFGRRALAGPALRENVLRQFRTPEKLSPRLSSNRPPALPRNRRRHNHVGQRSPLRSKTRRLLRQPGRRSNPRRRRRLFHLDARRTPHRANPRRIPRDGALLRRRSPRRNASQPSQKCSLGSPHNRRCSPRTKAQRIRRSPNDRSRQRQTPRSPPPAPNSSHRRHQLRKLERHVRLRLSGSRTRV